MLSQLQPIAIEDCLPFFQRLHSQLKDVHTDPSGSQSQNWTDISYCLRLSYTESLMKKNKFAFIVITDNEANIIGVNLNDQDAKRSPIPAPPQDARNSEIIQQMFSFIMAMRMQDFIDDGFIFGDTQKLLSEFLV